MEGFERDRVSALGTVKLWGRSGSARRDLRKQMDSDGGVR